MKTVKKLSAILLIFVLTLSFVGCSENDELANFKPTGVRVVQSVNGVTEEDTFDDADFAQKLWDTYRDLEISEEATGEMGESYFYMCLYDESMTTLGVFAIYENGSCCYESDNFEVFYTVENGEEKYEKFVEIYSEYADNNN